MYSLTIFQSQFDNRTHRTMDFDSWDEFADLLNSLSGKPLKSKKDAPLISPAVYEVGTTRQYRS